MGAELGGKKYREYKISQISYHAYLFESFLGCVQRTHHNNRGERQFATRERKKELTVYHLLIWASNVFKYIPFYCWKLLLQGTFFCLWKLFGAIGVCLGGLVCSGIVSVWQWMAWDVATESHWMCNHWMDGWMDGEHCLISGFSIKLPKSNAP